MLSNYRKLIVAIIGAGLMAGVAGCTPGDALVARQLTIVDGAAFVQENHSRRQAMRQQYYQVVDEVIGKCKEAARSAQFEGDFDAALDRVNWCLAFMESHYPSLATIELLREGFDAIDDLQQRLDQPAEPPG